MGKFDDIANALPPERDSPLWRQREEAGVCPVCGVLPCRHTVPNEADAAAPALDLNAMDRKAKKLRRDYAFTHSHEDMSILAGYVLALTARVRAAETAMGAKHLEAGFSVPEYIESLRRERDAYREESIKYRMRAEAAETPAGGGRGPQAG